MAPYVAHPALGTKSHEPHPAIPQRIAFAEPIRPIRAFEPAIENLLEAIERYRLRPGDRLPGETELARQLSISQPTLRQALRILERSGLLVMRRGSRGGIFVAAELIPEDLILSSIAKEESAVRDVLVGRRILETAVCELAADVATDDDYRELERALDLHRTHLGDRILTFRADGMYHRLVVRACHNEALQRAMRGVMRDMASVRSAYISGLESNAFSLEVHELQLDAMKKGRKEQLRALLDAHFRIVEEAFAAAVNKTWNELFRDRVGSNWPQIEARL
jgi:GntR family transcriptional regulator, transcriptional repressor for pyruvate dehydrogenase complex